MSRVEEQLNDLIISLSPAIGRDKEIDSLVNDHGEYGVALENICSIIEEKDIEVSQECLSKIINLAELMEFEQDSIKYYKQKIKVKVRTDSLND